MHCDKGALHLSRAERPCRPWGLRRQFASVASASPLGLWGVWGERPQREQPEDAARVARPQTRAPPRDHRNPALEEERANTEDGHNTEAQARDGRRGASPVTNLPQSNYTAKGTP